LIVLEHSAFLHVPKTGGTWVAHALHAAGVTFFQERVWDRDREPHDHVPLRWARQRYGDKRLFAFVRRPDLWWASYFHWKRHVGWRGKNGIDARCAAADFPTFIDRVLAHYPGHLRAVYEEFVGPADWPIWRVGRHERLVEELDAILTAAGERYDREALLAFGSRRINAAGAYVAEWRPGQREALLEAEAAVLARFYPEEAGVADLAE
jgi:hypothetical protein